MHQGVTDWVSRWLPAEVRTVVDVGGRNINGTAHQAFTGCRYDRWVVVDVRDDLRPDHADEFHVADFTDWVCPYPDVDVVLCTETFEHCPWEPIVYKSWNVLASYGKAIFTTVTPAFPPHSAEDGKQLRDGEYYEGVDPDRLERVMEHAGFAPLIEVNGAFLNAAGGKLLR